MLLDLVYQRGERTVHRSLHAGDGCLAHDGPVQEVDLGGLSAPNALLRRAEVRHIAHPHAHEPGQHLPDGEREAGEEAQAPVAESLHGSESHPPGDSDSHRLAHRRGDDAAEPTIVDDLLHAPPDDRGHRVQHVDDELRPLCAAEAADRDDRHGVGEDPGDASALGVGRSVAAAEVARRSSRHPHHPGLRVVRGDDREHPHARRTGKEPFGDGDAVEPVLHDDDGDAVDDGRIRGDGGLGILRLRAHEHEVWAHTERFAGVDARVRGSESAAQPDTVGQDRGEARAASRHLDVVPGAGEQRRECSAERTCADYADPHRPSVGRAARPTVSLYRVNSGILLVDKPQGITSHDVVSRMRRLAGTRKIGHAGTLDPMATGLLVLGVNNATRLLHYLVGLDKEYFATIRLGWNTTTDDAEGEPLAAASVDALAAATDAAIGHGIEALTGPIDQVPSAVSAIKVAGKRAYQRVRDGEVVELSPRRVTVSAFESVGRRDGDGFIDLDVRVECSSGTYVRALARDLGAALGTGGHLTALRRTRIGRFGVDEAGALEGFEVARHLMSPADAARRALPVVEVT